MPTPLSQFIVKVHGRCDLACDHCYMYEHADQSWRSKARAMSLDTIRVAASRIAEHASVHGLPSVKVILHGGEPLLAGPATLHAMLGILRATVEPVTSLRFGMQTNGVQLSAKFCDLLSRFNVRVGVSLDGYREANDLHRRYANGESSYDKVLRALQLLRSSEYRHLYAGLLCTIDIRNDPIRVYEALLAEQPPKIDFLLPHATWLQPPPRTAGDPTPYATWLGRIHRRWLEDGRPVRIRTFESLTLTANGGRSGTEQFGLEPVDIAVIETNGDWEQADSLKTSFDGAPATGLTVFANSADEVAALPELARRMGGIGQLSSTCRGCDVVNQCGGGLFAHRYSQDNGFDNPSVFCADLKEFITGMNATNELFALPPGLLEAIGRGHSEGSAIDHLVDRQLSVNRDLIESVGSELAGHRYAGAGWDLLIELDRQAPAAADLVLRHPYIRPWAVSCLKPDSLAQADNRGYLCAIAGAVAIHAGHTAELPVQVHAGQVHLPTVGSAYLPSSSKTPSVTLSIEPGRLTVAFEGQRLSVDLTNPEGSPWWQPSRAWRHEQLTVLLEDGDPYRECHNWQTATRLSPAAASAWFSTLDEAWKLIETETPQYLPGLRACLRAVTPLVAGSAGFKASTARHAFGAVAATFAPVASIAVMLIHECQHGKLGALLDLVDLLDPSCDDKLYVGWREDLRPVEGVLQGTYAHLAVADIWRCRVRNGGYGRAEAEANFKRYRDWTAAAVDSLRASRALTALGSRFVDQMAGELESWTA